MTEEQLAIPPSRQPMAWDDMEKMAKAVAASGMFGMNKPEQAICLFAICQSKGLDWISALERYHVIHGKPSMKADTMAAEFLRAGGAIIWHARTDVMAAATFLADKAAVTDESVKRSRSRFDLLWELEGEEDEGQKIKLVTAIAKHACPGEETILRTYADAEKKGLTKSREKNDQGTWEEKVKVNWLQSPRQMLTARVITEGVRLISPGLITGIYSPEEVQDFVQVERADREEFVDAATRWKGKRDRVAMQRMVDTYIEEAKMASPARASELKGLAADLRCQISDMDLERDEIPGLSKPATPIEAGVVTESPVPWREYVLRQVKSKTLRGRILGDFTAAEIRVVAEKSLPEGLEHSNPESRLEANYILEADKELNPDQYK